MAMPPAYKKDQEGYRVLEGAPSYCTGCGSKLKTGTEFCPTCGRSTRSKRAAGLKTAQMSLFDWSRRYYAMETLGGHQPRDIIDLDGNTIGRLRLNRSLRRWEFLETDGTIVSSMGEPKPKSFEIEDSAGRLIGRVKIGGWLLPLAYLENPGGRRVCEVKCYKWASTSWKYDARDEKGALVAEMDRVSSRNHKCAIVVHETAIDRRLLVPFAVAAMIYVLSRREKPSAIGLFAAGGLP